MSVTILGYILIPIGFFSLLLRPKYLMPLIFIFSGFTATVVFFIGDLGIQPAYFFFMLWIIRNFCGKRIRISGIIRQINCNMLLIVFMAYATISVVMPIILKGKNITVINVDGDITNLDFSSSCITQLIYLCFSIFFFLVLSDILSRNDKMANKLGKYYLIGCLLVCIVCIYQIISQKIGLPFDELFRQNVHGNYQGNRIYGPCIEASMLCYYLVTALPLCVRNNNIISWLLLGLCIVIGVYSFSSTFIIGIIVWLILEAYFVIKSGKVRFSSKKILFLNIGIVVTTIIVFCNYDFIAYTINKLILTINSQNVSGMERFSFFKIMMNAFYQSPVFGIGFGTSRGTDLFSTWIAEFGILGVSIFAVYIVKTITNSKADIKYIISILILWFVMLISVPEPYNFFIWILLSFVKTSSSIKKGEKLYA